MTEIGLLKDTPDVEPCATLVLAHGAGAPMDSEFMNAISLQISKRACEVIRFEFPYMCKRRDQGGRRPPDRAPILLASWRECVAQVRAGLPSGRKLFIGGKSLGGRMASLIAEEVQPDGLVCLGYPFHPANKPEGLRTSHLVDLQIPTLIVQGTRDPLGSIDEVANYPLSTAINIQWLADGDHDFKPRVKSGYSHQQHIETAAQHIVRFIDCL